MNLIRKALPKIVSGFPLKSRLKVVSILSVLLAPVFKLRSGLLERLKEKYRFDTGTSMPFMWCLGALSHVRIDFKIQIDDKKIKQARDANKGVLLIGYHGELMLLAIPHLTNLGFKIVTLGVRENDQVWGRNVKNEIQFTSMSLLKVKKRLSKGEIVAVMIDTIYPDPNRTIQIDSVFGKIDISNSVFKVAAILNCEIMFFKYKVKKGVIIFEVGSPSTNKCSRAITSDYIQFLST